MKLQRLIAKNIFSLGEVDINLSNRGLVLVTGYSFDDMNENGAGKSSLANHAIVWGLYGQTQDGFKADDVINRHSTSKSSLVEIHFVGVDGEPYILRRSRNPNKLSLFKNKVDISHKVEKETQKSINMVLGRDFHTFIQSDLIGPGIERSFCKLPVSEQVSVIEDLLPIYQLNSWAENAKGFKTKVKDKISEISKEKLTIESSISTLKDSYENIRNQHYMWKGEQSKKIVKTRDNIKTLSDIQTFKSEKIKEKQEFIKNTLSKIPEKCKDVSSLTSIRDTTFSELGSVNQEIKRLRSIEDKNECPTCSQPLTDNISTKNHLIKLNSEYKELNEWLNSSIEWMENLKKIKEAEEWIRYETNTSKEGELIKLTAELDSLEKEQSPYESTLSTIQNSIESKSKGLDKLIKYATSLDKHLKWLEFWERAFSTDLKTMMIEEVCPFIENKINSYLAALNNPQFKAVVSTTKTLKSGDIRDRFTLDISSDNGANNFGMLSVGEKQIICFAVSLALSDLAATQAQGASDILILDEPLMGLSAKNCENVVNFLVSHKKGTILLISNEDNLKSLISNRIHVTKSKGLTWLE